MTLRPDPRALARIVLFGAAVFAGVGGSQAHAAGQWQPVVTPDVSVVHYGTGGQPYAAHGTVSIDQPPAPLPPATPKLPKRASVSRPAVAVLVFIVAGVLFFVGRWGKRNAPRLVPVTFSPAGRVKRERALRRGVFSAQVVAVILVLAAIGVLVIPGA